MHRIVLPLQELGTTLVTCGKGKNWLSSKAHGFNLVSPGFDDWVFTLLATELFGGETPILEACPVSPLVMQFLFKGCCWFYDVYKPSLSQWVVPAVSWVL